jgi:hypothetical protein
MSISTDPYVWVAAILTLAVFSFLYKDNPLFCFAEHMLLGLSTGYLIATTWHSVFMPELVTPLLEHGTDTQIHLWGALMLCFFWACKYLEKAEDLYRLALAFWVAIDMGLLIPTMMESNVLAQVSGTINLSFDGDPDEVLGNLVLIIGTITALTYFLFSRAHKGVLGVTAKVGTWFLMIGFGATFSYTILSRIYLLIGRLLFLLRDWLGVVN